MALTCFLLDFFKVKSPGYYDVYQKHRISCKTLKIKTNTQTVKHMFNPSDLKPMQKLKIAVHAAAAVSRSS